MYACRKNMTLKKKAKTLLHKCKSDYFTQKIESDRGNAAATWSTLRQLIPTTTNKACPMLAGDEELKDKVNGFNKFFANVGKQTFEKTQHNSPNHNNTPQPDTDPAYTPAGSNLFRPQPTDSNTLVLVIKQLRNTSSCGSDGIPLRFLKESLPVSIPYLTCILNTSIVTGSFSCLWKHAIVVPIYKSGDANESKKLSPNIFAPHHLKDFRKSDSKTTHSILGSKPPAQ